jgi:hypothetical protein
MHKKSINAYQAISNWHALFVVCVLRDIRAKIRTRQSTRNNAMTESQTEITRVDRTGGLPATEALSGCAARLAELMAAIAKDGSAGPNVLALASEMAQDVEMLVSELEKDGVISLMNPFTVVPVGMPRTARQQRTRALPMG